MLKSLTICAVLALVPAAGAAQEVADSLDWHRYFPLEVGNQWQYEDKEDGPSSRFWIQDEITANGKHYFVATETYFGSWSEPYHEPRTVYLRYDSSGIVAEFDDPADDDGNLPTEFSRGLESFPHVDLRLAFGASVSTTVPVTEIAIGGGYRETVIFNGVEVPTPAVKSFDQDQVWFWNFVADIGFTGGGNLWGPALKYARIGGVEYGAMIVARESDDAPESPGSVPALDIYPNPAAQSLEVVFDRTGPEPDTIELVSVDGRIVLSARATHGIPGQEVRSRFDISTLAPGVYYARIPGSTRPAAPFVVIR